MSLYGKLRVEDELLICCARNNIESPILEKIETLLKQDLDWDYLIDQASNHSLRSLLYFQLNQICSEKVPKHLRDQLRDHYTYNAHRNLLMMGELFRILKILDAKGIKVIPYKGPVLAVSVYKTLALREFADLDIFVDKKDVLKVKRLLVSSGYEPKLKLSKEREVQYLKMQREYQYINKENGVCVETQWNLTDISLSFPNEPVFKMDQIKPQLVEIKSKKISVFSDEDLLLILSLHTVTHLWGKLSLICDIAELIKKSNKLDWDMIMGKAHQMAIEKIFYLNLDLASELFDIKLPFDVIVKIESYTDIACLKQDIIKILFDNTNFSFLQKVLLRFRVREKKTNKIKDFIKIITLPTTTEWKKFGKNLPFELYYIIQWPILIINKMRK